MTELDRFAYTHDLRSNCRFDSNVDSLSYASTDRTGTLTVTDIRTGESMSAPYDLVIWATMAAFANTPRLLGPEEFRGRQQHTTQFSSEELEEIVCAYRPVVVVGGGRAASDVVKSLRRAGYENFTWVTRKPYLLL